MAIQPTQVEAVFAEAILKTTPQERAAYLDQACNADMELRARVEALLLAHDPADSFLEPITLPTAHLLHEHPGSTIGPYKLLQQIGEGGFGVVFMAEQERPISRKVALKIIKLGMDTRQVIARFEAERQALAMMDHPNIAKVLDAGATESGRPYFVMELVRGIPITEYCDSNKLDTRSRLELFIPVCRAVQHAHQKGIIHRDIKPSNVLVTLHDGVPVPKVIDFGIAKATAGRLTERTLFTEFRQILGTPEYMSPEQAEMSGLDIDTRADVYSLGVLLYELLTGTTPFEPQKLRKAAYAEIQRIIREIDPPAPSTRVSTLGDSLNDIAARRQIEPSKLGRLIRGELDWIVMRCLDKDRKRRYDTAVGLASDLQRFLQDEPIEASPPSTAYRVRKLARRYRTPLRVAVVITLLLLGATALSTWQAARAWHAEAKAVAAQQFADRQRDVAMAEKKRADEQAAVANAVNEFILTDVIGGAAKMEGEPIPFVGGRSEPSLSQCFDAAMKNSPGRFAHEPRFEAAIRAAVGRMCVESRQFEIARENLDIALQLSKRVLGDEHPSTLDIQQNLARLCESTGQPAVAEQLYRDTLAAYRKANGDHHQQTIAAARSLAALYCFAGRTEEAKKIAATLLGSPAALADLRVPPSVADKLSDMPLFSRSGHHAANDPVAVQRLLDMTTIVFGERHPQTLAQMRNLGDAFDVSKQYAKAASAYLAVLNESEKLVGARHPDTIATARCLAWVYRQSKQFDAMREIANRFLRSPEALMDQSVPFSLYDLQHTAWTDIPGRVEMLSMTQDIYGPTHARTLDDLRWLAIGYHEAGNTQAVDQLAKQTFPMLPPLSSFPPRLRTAYALVHGTFGMIYFQRGDHARAEADLAVWCRHLEDLQQVPEPDLPLDSPYIMRDNTRYADIVKEPFAMLVQSCRANGNLQLAADWEHRARVYRKNATRSQSSASAPE